MKEKFDFYDKTSIKSYNLDEKIRYQLKILDSLDAFTRRHCENVATITCRLCELLKMSEGFTIYCTTCAYLHDVGKMFIPPAVLQKPGKLTEEEYTIMKSHTTIGNEICMKDEKLRPYAAGALFHHEALNGSGYPNGVKGNNIPYEAQIIRVADEYEAITSKRQYKSHIGIIETLNILIGNAKAGKIDKKILKCLFKVVIEDTEFEICSRLDYLKYLKKEIKRMETAYKYYRKMEASITASKKDYFYQYAKMYLKENEKVEIIPEMLNDLKNSYEKKAGTINELYLEIRQIKHLVV